MTKSNRLFDILDAMTVQLPSRSVTIKIRTGWNEKAPIAHELIPQIQRRFDSNLSAIMVRVVDINNIRNIFIHDCVPLCYFYTLIMLVLCQKRQVYTYISIFPELCLLLYCYVYYVYYAHCVYFYNVYFYDVYFYDVYFYDVYNVYNVY